MKCSDFILSILDNYCIEHLNIQVTYCTDMTCPRKYPFYKYIYVYTVINNQTFKVEC